MPNPQSSSPGYGRLEKHAPFPAGLHGSTHEHVA
jgi:hypothetical protein